MDITILHKLMDEYYDLSLFPKVKQTLERKDGRVIMSFRSFAPKEWGIKDNTLRRYDIEATKRLIEERKDQIADHIYDAIVDYLMAYGTFQEVLNKVSKTRTFDDSDSKMRWCRQVLYYLETMILLLEYS